MLARLQPLAASIRESFAKLAPARGAILFVAVVGVAVWALAKNPPLRTLARGEAGVRENLVTGEVIQWRDGSVLVIPFVHEMHVYSMRDRIYRPVQMSRADGPAPLQSLEGLSLGVDLSVRYALDPASLRAVAAKLPEDIDGQVVEPAVSGIIYKIFARYTVKEIFSTKRAEIQQAIDKELRARLAQDGVALHDVLMGKVDLPADYRRGMDQLLAEELATEKMKYTLDLKDKRVKEVALEGEADKARREKAAEASAREQVIAAKAQEEAMKHVLPFKQRQVEQRKLEAEAEKQARIRGAEGAAQARRIEANGESDARQRLADAEAYRLEKVGKVNAEQMEREGVVVTAHPLLIQKTLAEKLSDKVQVIIAPPGDGVITAALLGEEAMSRALRFFVALAALLLAAPALADPAIAIVVGDQTPLRPAPRDSSKPHALLWQGEALEVRGERMDYLQVYDHRLERGGFVSARSVRRVSTGPAAAPELLAVLRFLREAPGSEALGIGYAALYIQAAPAEALRGPQGAEALEALGSFAERLARSASTGAASTRAAQAALSGHLEIAMGYGVAFTSFERDSRMVICYDGDAFRRLIDLGRGDALQRAHAVLSLTRADCSDDSVKPIERRAVDEARAELLEAIDVSGLPLYLRNRVHMRRAAVWNSLAFHSARRGEPAQSAAARALEELARVDKHELTDADQRTYADAAMRVNASRWAALPAHPAEPAAKGSNRPRLVMAKGQPGETCVLLVDAKHEPGNELAKRCTYGIAWEDSATLNREGNALALAVQHTEAWRELWIFRKAAKRWTVATLPPAATAPGVGYAEFAGWVPGGKQLLVAREASGEGKYKRSYELVRIGTLATVGAAPDPQLLPAFQRWQDAQWKQASLSLR